MIGVAYGAKVIAVDNSPLARAKVRGEPNSLLLRAETVVQIFLSVTAFLWQAEELGAIASIDASLGDDHVRAEVGRLTDDVGADITVDAAGFVSTVENAVRAHVHAAKCLVPHDDVA